MTRVSSFTLIGIALVTGLLAPMLPARTMAQDATPAADCPVTSPEENKEIARGWFTALAEGAGADVAALATADVVYHDPSPSGDRETGGANEWASKRQEDYPDLQVTVERVIAEGDMVASYQRYTGTQQGDSEDNQGVPATGMPVEWVSMAIFRISCGKIAEIWTVADDLGRLQRLGVISDEELNSAAPVATPTS